MKRKSKIEWQKLSEIGGSPESYQNYVAKHREEGEIGESLRANPDNFVATDTGITEPERIMGEAVEHLQGRQKEVYLLTMRTGKSLADAAEILGITKAAAQSYKDRAIKFVAAYCQAAIAKGEKE